jgi:pimeloyl-ACP methyl ester carboxylesterase
VGKGVLAGAVAALATLLLGGGAAASPSTFARCASSTPVLCGTVAVPLDRSGHVRGTVDLHVEELPGATGSSSRFLYLVAGGPGQPSAAAFDLRRYGRLFQQLFPGETLVAYDDRGTGRSDAISCPGSGAIVTAAPAAAKRIVDACARRLGSHSRFYSTRANAADMDAVRRALGTGRISIYGVSYGTEQALVYGLLYPAHVDRLVLDSMVPPGQNQLGLDTLQAIPRALAQICTAACGRAIPNPGAELARLENRLAAHPQSVRLARPGKAPATVRVDSARLLTLTADTDLDDGLAAAVPAAVETALSGDLRPLARLLTIDDAFNQTAGVDAAVDIATECNDGPVPWAQGATRAQRVAGIRRLLAGVTNRELGLFGRWVLAGSVPADCIDWQGAGAAAPPRAHRLAGVKTLILSGSRDVRTPTSGATAVEAALGNARVLVVPGSGHDVLQSSACPALAVRSWVAEGTAPQSCPRVPLELSALTPLRQPDGTGRLGAQQTATVVAQTLAEVAALATAYEGAKGLTAGLAAGQLQVRSFAEAQISGFADVAGITVSGTVSNLNDGSSDWRANVTVGGSRAAAGQVNVAGNRLTGKLGGKSVSVGVGS